MKGRWITSDDSIGGHGYTQENTLLCDTLSRIIAAAGIKLTPDKGNIVAEPLPGGDGGHEDLLCNGNAVRR